MSINLNLDLGLNPKNIIYNGCHAVLYEHSLKSEQKSKLSSNGALVVYSGSKTGRSPSDKRIVNHIESAINIDWGKVNIEINEEIFEINKERAFDYFNTKDVYIIDGYAGWDLKFRKKVRIVCTRPYHALFMRNMLVMSEVEVEEYGEPDYTIYNAGEFPANKNTSNMTSKTSISLNLESGEMVILGTEYAGEMKKGVFTIFNYIMPLQNILPMHCSANESKSGETSLFFGLSGTGKTTLSADSKRQLIGDDEHCWTTDGIFNIEGGCYAKAVGLTKENEPEIFNAIKFGTVLENVVLNEVNREVDYHDISITENTRAAYPISYIENAKIPCIGGHPKNIIFLTCDAYGVLPPVSKLTAHQASYHFMSGYTAKVAGTEMGVKEPSATFSACFGAAFMVWHPNKYAELLAQKIQDHSSKVWLINTGWIGGSYGEGNRIKLKYTRAIIDAIHDGSLDKERFTKFDVFDLEIPTKCNGVPDEILNPINTWKDKTLFTKNLNHLAKLFNDNFEKFKKSTNQKIIDSGPKV